MTRLEELIRSGQFRSGSKLPPEKQLAETLGVSRHTLREVLKGLHMFGIIRSRAGDGTYLQRSSTGIFTKAIHLRLLLEEVNFMDLLDTRLLIEPVLAGMAAEKATRRDLEVVRREIQGMESNQGLPEKYLQHEMAFHRHVALAADSPILRAVMEGLEDLLQEARLTVLEEQGSRHNLNFHVRILEAIEGRDPEAAHQRMQEHLLDSKKKYVRYYEQHRQQPRRREPAKDEMDGGPGGA
jgi:GntR family transcriptional repressor for pyruvate dehydrogenase complex